MYVDKTTVTRKDGREYTQWFGIVPFNFNRMYSVLASLRKPSIVPVFDGRSYSLPCLGHFWYNNFLELSPLGELLALDIAIYLYQ